MDMFSKLIDPRNPVTKVLSNIFDLAVLNILWILFSIPIITMGSATAAVSSVSLQMIRDNSNGVLVPFWRAFKESFMAVTMVWVPSLLILAALIFDVWYFLMVQDFITGAIQAIICGVIILIILNILLLLTYYICLTVLFENTVRESLRNAFIFTLSNPIRNAAVILLDASVIVFSLYVPLNMAFPVVILLFFGVSLTIFLNCKILYPIFKPYISEDATQHEDNNEV